MCRREKNKILSYNDVSDGGLLDRISEMAFAGRVGVDILLDEILSDKNDCIDTLLNEELGVVIQIETKEKDAVMSCACEDFELIMVLDRVPSRL